MRILVLEHNGEIVGAYRNETQVNGAIMDVLADSNDLGKYNSTCRYKPDLYMYEHVFRTTIVTNVADEE